MVDLQERRKNAVPLVLTMDGPEVTVLDTMAVDDAEAGAAVQAFLAREVVVKTCPKETQFHLHTLVASLGGAEN